MAVVAREIAHEVADFRLTDQPPLHLRLVEIPAPAAERAWPAWVIGGSIVGTVAGLLYVVTTLA
jgi:hypothetical protein